MSGRSKTLLSTGIILVVILIALVIWGPKLYLKIMEKEVDNISITQTRIRKDHIDMNIQVNLSEKSIPLLMDSMYYRTIIYDTVISEGVKRFDPDKRYDKALIFPVSINNTFLKKKIKKHQGEKTDVQMYITHFLDLPLLGKRRVEVVKHVHMVIPVIPEAWIRDIKLTDLGLAHISMLVTVAVYNPNNMDFTVTDMKYQTQVKDYAFSHGSLDKPVHIKRFDTTFITVPVHTKLEHQLKAAWETLKGDTEWPYYLKTHMVLHPSDSRIDDVQMASEKKGMVDVKEALKAMKNKERVGEHR